VESVKDDDADRLGKHSSDLFCAPLRRNIAVTALISFRHAVQRQKESLGC